MLVLKLKCSINKGDSPIFIVILKFNNDLKTKFFKDEERECWHIQQSPALNCTIWWLTLMNEKGCQMVFILNGGGVLRNQ